jgi:hypothetical protein
MKTEDYIGSGVYVEYVAGGVWIKANHHEHPTDKVWLDNYAWQSLKRFMERMQQQAHEQIE